MDLELSLPARKIRALVEAMLQAVKKTHGLELTEVSQLSAMKKPHESLWLRQTGHTLWFRVREFNSLMPVQ